MLAIRASLHDDRLQVHWQGNAPLSGRSLDALVSRFEETLSTLIHHGLSDETGSAVTGSDFPHVDLGDEDLDALSDKL